MQLLSGLGQGSPGLHNPLLYYSYYAQVTPTSRHTHHTTSQMLAAMQAQQKLLDLPQSNNNNNNLASVKDLLSPLRLGAMAGFKTESVSTRVHH